MWLVSLLCYAFSFSCACSCSCAYFSVFVCCCTLLRSSGLGLFHWRTATTAAAAAAGASLRPGVHVPESWSGRRTRTSTSFYYRYSTILIIAAIQSCSLYYEARLWCFIGHLLLWTRAWTPSDPRLRRLLWPKQRPSVRRLQSSTAENGAY